MLVMQWVDAVLKCGNISEGAHTQTNTHKCKGFLRTDGTITTLVLMEMDHNHEKNGEK